MLNKNIISDFLGIRNVLIDKISEKSKFIKIHLYTNKSGQVCPCCKNTSNRVHDYREQTVKHSAYRGKQVLLVLKKRRYVCLNCNKRFYEKYSFLPKYYRSTNILYANIIDKLHTKLSIKDIAKEQHVSPNIVSRALKLVSFTNKPELPVILGIDEFKGNTGGEKYNLILTNLHDNKMSDLLPTRKKSDIISYFKRYTIEERQKVKVFVMDMTNNYKEIAWLFPSAEIVVDKYHYVRQVYFALDAVRKRIQKEFPDNKRLHFKRNKYVLWKKYSELSEDDKIVLRRMLDQSEDLYVAWSLKEWFIEIKELKREKHARKELHNWLLSAEESNLPEFKACITAFRNWFGYIINGYRHKVTNGFTEGMNNNIKVLKRIGYGYRNFESFRKRILLCFG